MDRLFDSQAFARRLRAAMDERPDVTWRDLVAQARVSKATISRALNAEPNLSHENVLRLQAWIETPQPVAQAA